MTRNPVRALIEALAEADGVAPDELDYALYEYIVPDVLTTLASREDESWELTFAVADHRVTLTGSGAIYIDGSLSRVTTDASREGVTHIDPDSIAAHAQYPEVLDSLSGVVYRCRNERGWPIDFLSGGCRQLTGYDPNAFVVGGVSIGEDVIHQMIGRLSGRRFRKRFRPKSQSPSPTGFALQPVRKSTCGRSGKVCSKTGRPLLSSDSSPQTPSGN